MGTGREPGSGPWRDFRKKSSSRAGNGVDGWHVFGHDAYVTIYLSRAPLMNVVRLRSSTVRYIDYREFIADIG